ncbi:MAG: cellulase family glycosylhydrolase [Mycobacteriales bacterium]
MTRIDGRRLLAVAAAAVLLPLLAAIGARPAAAGTGHGFVTRHGSTLLLDGRPFRFAGTNNYYLMYDSPFMADDVLSRVATARFPVLRTDAFLDIGNQDGSNSVGSGKANGVYFQFWDGTEPAYNDGDDGLAHLDYVIWRAGQLGIKLVIPVTNNWTDFGGMDQYVRWAGDQHHDDFYTDPRIRGWYQAWIAHLLSHVNPRTGLAYSDDPTIMTWELGNEPRCQGSGAYPTSGACTAATVTGWADTMSRYVKSIDHHHLTSVGDEGFTCTDPGGPDWTDNCATGVDSAALARLPAIDVMSFHLYPDGWGKTPDWGTTWITQHLADARAAHKAAMLGEFGLLNHATRNPVYQRWTTAAIDGGASGLLYWMLAGLQDNGTRYPDYDGFTVYCPSPVCLTITHAETTISTGRRSFPPVADDDTAVTPFGTPVALSPAGNDIAYDRAHVVPASVDLDPATAGQQTTLTVPAGRFTLAADGAVGFTPAASYHGTVTVPYTVRDSYRRLSNAATLTVTVKPDPAAPIVVTSFEDGLDGWAPGSWQANAGTLSPTSDFHTDGAAGVHVEAADGGWFGLTFPTPLDLSTKSTLKVDVRAGAAAGTPMDIAIQVGPGFTWCQGTFGWVDAGTSATFAVDLGTGLDCGAADTGDVRTLYVFFGPGSFDLDYVRAE